MLVLLLTQGINKHSENALATDTVSSRIISRILRKAAARRSHAASGAEPIVVRACLNQDFRDGAGWEVQPGLISCDMTHLRSLCRRVAGAQRMAGAVLLQVFDFSFLAVSDRTVAAIEACDVLYVRGGRATQATNAALAPESRVVKCIRECVCYDLVTYIGVCEGAIHGGSRCFDFFNGASVGYAPNVGPHMLQPLGLMQNPLTLNSGCAIAVDTIVHRSGYVADEPAPGGGHVATMIPTAKGDNQAGWRAYAEAGQDVLDRYVYDIAVQREVYWWENEGWWIFSLDGRCWMVLGGTDRMNRPALRTCVAVPPEGARYDIP